MPGWATFDVVIGAAAGALIGLLFVSVSIRVEAFAASSEFRSRGAETLCLFTAVLLVAVVLSIPSQHRWELGAEFVVLAVALGAVLSLLDRRASGADNPTRIGRVLGELSPDAITAVLLFVAGAC